MIWHEEIRTSLNVAHAPLSESTSTNGGRYGLDAALSAGRPGAPCPGVARLVRYRYAQDLRRPSPPRSPSKGTFRGRNVPRGGLELPRAGVLRRGRPTRWTLRNQPGSVASSERATGNDVLGSTAGIFFRQGCLPAATVDDERAPSRATPVFYRIWLEFYRNCCLRVVRRVGWGAGESLLATHPPNPACLLSAGRTGSPAPSPTS
jgi:hypothetical protein